MNETKRLAKKAREAHVTQADPVDGGSAACLSALVRYYGADIHPVQVQALTWKEDEGSNLLQLHEAATTLGFKSSAYQADLTSLMEHPLPSILHLVRENGTQQFAVCYGFDGSYFIVGDPEKGVDKIIPKQLLELWDTRTLLSVEPQDDFQVKLRQYQQKSLQEPSPAASRNQSDRYSAVGMTGELIGVNKMLLISDRTQAGRILPAELAQVVLAMQEFDTLENHLNAAVVRYANVPVQRKPEKGLQGVDPADTQGTAHQITEFRKQALRGSLESLVNEGFLVSERQIRKEILEQCDRLSVIEPAAERVQSLGIPTCNRPESFHTALRSYIQNIQRHSRDVIFYVSDDAPDGHGQAAVKHIVQALEKSTNENILYGNRPMREQYIKRLSDYMMIAPELLHFAFLGDATSFAVGASRNTILAAATGEMQVQVDDDSVCQLAPAPDQENGVDISARFEVNQHWFHTDFEDSIADVAFLNKDFIQLHEDMLGVPVASLLNTRIGTERELTVDGINSELLRRISNAHTRVALTFMGLAGDCGMGQAGNLGFLLLTADSLRRLVENRQKYAANRVTRYVKCVPRRMVLTDSPACMSGNIGLDARETLPPFMPINRNGDGVFGAVHRACSTRTLKGYIPYMLLHHPPEKRTFRSRISDSILSPRLNDGMRMVIMAYESNLNGDDTSKNMVILGEYLHMLGSLDITEFQHQLFPIIRQALTRHLVSAELHLQRHTEAPDYWKNDLRNYIETYQEKLTNPEFLIPYDLPGDSQKRMQLFQRFMGQYGALLATWPDITQAAGELRQKEILPFKAVE
ncbi:MAG TPA: cysteine peptidase family C39 domain-containing protein [bacterium]|nr:cysteine peptidase family C39 domain-containing protein [bacterium]